MDLQLDIYNIRVIKPVVLGEQVFMLRIEQILD